MALNWNKTLQMLTSNFWNLLSDINSAFSSANVITPVASSTERDALAPPGGKYPGMAVARTDVAGTPLETYDGTAWNRVQGVEYTTFVVDPGNTNWLNNTATLRRVRNADGTTTVWLEWTAVRGTGSSFAVTSTMQASTFAAVPSGWAPGSRFHFWGAARDNAGVNYIGPVVAQVDSGGQISVAHANGGSLTVPTSGSIYFVGMWRV